MITFFLVLFGPIAAFGIIVAFLDWLGRRQERLHAQQTKPT